MIRLVYGSDPAESVRWLFENDEPFQRVSAGEP